MNQIKTTFVIAALLGGVFSVQANDPVLSSIGISTAPLQKTGYVGAFEAEGRKIDVKFVRVIYAAEGSELPGESNSVKQLVFDSKDPRGNPVKVVRFQITAKNTGYDEVQQEKDEDFKMKSVTEGVKLHVEVPLDRRGRLQLDRAYVGNLAYNFGTRETRHNLGPETVSDLKLTIKQLDLPSFGPAHKPGDFGVIYNQGFIDLTLTSKAKHVSSDRISDFNVEIKGPITLTHVRGAERQDNAVSIDPGVVGHNVR